MTERREDLDAQIDALMTDVQKSDEQPAPGAKADDQADPSPAPAGEAANGQAPADGDIAGMALADEIQEMLDEAAAGHADPPDEPAQAEPQPAEPVDPDEAAEQREKELVAQIDQMLAEQAEAVMESEDDVSGSFESIDEVLDAAPADSSDDPPTEPAEASGEPVAAAPAEPSGKDQPDDNAIDGEIQTLEHVLGDEDKASPEDQPAAPVAEEEALTPGAAAVAEELDAEQAAGPPVVDDPLAQAPDESNEAPAGRPRREIAVAIARRVLEPVNRPFSRLSPTVRDTLGWIGLSNAAAAVALLLYVLLFKG